MSELKITAGFNDFTLDPLRMAAVDAARPAVDEQDPAVVARCPDVLKEILSLVYRFETPESLAAKAHPDQSDSQEQFVAITTPEIGYVTQDGHEATIRFMADCVLPDLKVPEFNLAHSRVYLQGKPVPRADYSRPFLHLISLYPNRINRNGVMGRSAGAHDDLNYLQVLTTRVREAAFPKAK